MIEVIAYTDYRGRNPFRRWFARLDPIAVGRVTAAIEQMEAGNLSNVRSVGRGVSEYRIYFGRDGDTLIILLGGGTKRRQHRDIENARASWQEYGRRKRQER